MSNNDSREGRSVGLKTESLDELFRALESHRRRYVLYTLREADGEETLTTLAREVAAIEDGVDPEDVDSERCRNVYLDLYHCHLPLLDRADLVQYDGSDGTVSLQVSGSAAQYVDLATEDEFEDPSGFPPGG